MRNLDLLVAWARGNPRWGDRYSLGIPLGVACMIVLLLNGVGCGGDGVETVPRFTEDRNPSPLPDASNSSDTGVSSDEGVADGKGDGLNNPMPDAGGEVDSGPDGGPAKELRSRSWVLGYSVLGRPIVGEVFGNQGPILFVLSAIHGNEDSSVSFGERFRSLLLGGLAEEAGTRVVYIAYANPDGIELGTRENANGIDLNRNFDAQNFMPGGPGGQSPLSQPETRVLADIVEATEPTAVISVHCCVPTVDYDGPADGLAEAMGEVMPRVPIEQLGASAGSMGSWVGLDLDIPIITLEFARETFYATSEQLEDFVNGLYAGMLWVAENGENRDNIDLEQVMSELSVQAQKPPATAPYTSFALGRSAGGRLLRAELLGQGSPKVLILAGAEDNDRRALFLAEHVRRSILAAASSGLPPVMLVTSLNPDGVFQESPRNAKGDDVALDWASAGSTPEVSALTDMIENEPPEYVLIIDAHPERDTVAVEKLLPSQLPGPRAPSLAIEPQIEGPFAAYLDALGIPLVRFGVHTLFAFGDLYDEAEENAYFEDPRIFGDYAVKILRDLP